MGDDHANLKNIQVSTETMKAMNGSVEKWQKIVAGEGVDGGEDDCPLCILSIENGCEGCPVSAHTKRTRCRNTPYQEWFDHVDDFHWREDMPYKVHCATCLSLANDQLRFLEMVRDLCVCVEENGGGESG